jgi:hypothetical protein
VTSRPYELVCPLRDTWPVLDDRERSGGRARGQLDDTIVFPQHRSEELGSGVSSMYLSEIPTPGGVPPQDLCPFCASPEPPIVTLVTSWNRYYRCAPCGFLWSVTSASGPPAQEL